MAQNNFKVLTKEEEQANYNLRDLRFYKMSPYNESIAYVIDGDNLLVIPNVPAAEHSIILSTSDFDSNNLPLLPENDTPYYRYRELMNKEGFTKESMLNILKELNFNYQKDTFYADAERFAKRLSIEDKIKFFIPALYFIGEDLQELCPNAEWQFHILYYFQPFAEVSLYYEKWQFSFYDLNLLLEAKLLSGKSITFKNIYKKVAGYYLKEKNIWDLH